MSRIIDVVWEVVTSVGRTVEQFDDEERARKYLRERNADPGRELPGACVERVETVVTRTRAYTPRGQRASDEAGRQRLRLVG